MGKKVITFFITTILIISLVGCTKEKSKDTKLKDPISRTELFMGTAIKITLYDGGSEEILDKAFKRVIDLEDLVSINKSGTEIVELNKNSGINPVKLSDDSFNIIEKGLEYSKASKGGYDITIGPLVKLWSIGLPEAKVPNENEIKEAIKHVDYSKLKINKDTNEVFLSEKGMMIDLGSIAKGYAADEIVKLLKEEGVTEAIVDLGGNIYALGKKEGNKNWKIGIQDPNTERGNVVGMVETYNKSVVTTGVYERFIEKDGVKYHHILNPKIGYPYKTDIAGVSIIADKSMDADALSTLIFTKGLDEGIKFIETLDGVDAIFIMNDRKVYITEGVRESFKLTNESFELAN
ncbi:FAD:protein FMN transferase [Clostridium sardiniense]|uniref:FAD:protein FMN transferase n=1 Tax=Clostridium sardiniense TaxID=29369 RepID=A0ABS7L2G5_CLOSR|nr:FAD:protein FMN transferase [Clostridium sardiniense]MBY0756887.1 FAD:protein FMN transferase [Clostridium sardiniense]MDQ0458732.1 thiamine biosynthesis lipoprotein [Clostridium sardiniense]